MGTASIWATPRHACTGAGNDGVATLTSEVEIGSRTLLTRVLSGGTSCKYYITLFPSQVSR